MRTFSSADDDAIIVPSGVPGVGHEGVRVILEGASFVDIIVDVPYLAFPATQGYKLLAIQREGERVDSTMMGGPLPRDDAACCVPVPS